MNGIPPEITNRAEHLARLAAQGEDLVAVCATMSETEVAELQNGVSLIRLLFLYLLFRALDFSINYYFL